MSPAPPSDAPGSASVEDASGADRPDVVVEQAGDVALVELRRPPHNLLTEPALRRLADAVHSLAGSARAAVLCASGRSFCAGADFRASDAPDPTAAGSFVEQTGAFYRQAARIFDSPVPLVAAVHGAAIGAGFGLALACDVRVVGGRGFFQANFVRLGIHPGFALSAVLPRFVGPGRAAELFLTGRRVGAEEAGRVGLAEQVVAEGAEREAALALAREIALGAPLATASTRATLRAGLAEEAARVMEHELAEQAALAGTADAVEGVSAVLEGRSPRFTGR